MDLNNYFVFDGEKSSDLDTYIAGEGTFNAPERVYTMQNIPGRNGQIALDEGRFENYELKYPAFIFTSAGADFRRKISELRNALLSKKGYKRLTDTYHPDEYRLAIYREGLETKPVQYNRAGEFDLVFDCKPQRFLLEGEVPISYPKSPTGEVTTATGTSVSVDNAGENKKVITELKETIPLEIDDNGYGSTWAPGANEKSIAKLPQWFKTAGSETHGTVTFTWIDDTTVQVTGTSTEGQYLEENRGVTASSPDAVRFPSSGYYRLLVKGDAHVRLWVGPADGSSSMRIYGHNQQFYAYTDYVYIVDVIQYANYAEPEGTTSFAVAKYASGDPVYPLIPYTNQGTFVEQTETHLLQTCEGITASYPVDLGEVADNYGGELEYVTGAYTNKYKVYSVVPSNLGWRLSSTDTQTSLFLAPSSHRIAKDTIVSGMFTSYSSAELESNVNIEGIANYSDNTVTNRLMLRILNSRLTEVSVSGLLAYLPDVLNIAGENTSPLDYNVEKSTFLLYDGINTFTAGGHQLSLKYMDNPNIIENPTQFPSKPVIEVEGNGTLYIGNVAITIGGSSHTVIDCETMEAYDGYTSKNSDISISSIDFPVLDAGKTGLILGDGITSVTIIPRWWKI